MTLIDCMHYEDMGNHLQVLVDVPKDTKTFADGNDYYNQFKLKSLSNYWSSENETNAVTVYDIYKSLGLRPKPLHANLIFQKGRKISIELVAEFETYYGVQISDV